MTCAAVSILVGVTTWALVTRHRSRGPDPETATAWVRRLRRGDRVWLVRVAPDGSERRVMAAVEGWRRKRLLVSDGAETVELDRTGAYVAARVLSLRDVVEVTP